jgi:molecular chaperone DnaK (HSP70)
MRKVICIDLGTTNSCVTIMEGSALWDALQLRLDGGVLEPELAIAVDPLVSTEPHELSVRDTTLRSLIIV